MTTLDTIDNKISQIKKYLGQTEAFKKYSRQEIETDDLVRPALEHVLFLITQSVIDLGDMLISYRAFRKPGNQSEIFQILKENNVIPRELEEKLISMTGFRNVIAHDYAKVNYDRVYEVLHKDLKDIEEFIEVVSRIK